MHEQEEIFIGDIFTPMGVAQLTFVDREPAASKLVNALLSSSNQVVLWGASGSGKTTLLANKLHQLNRNYITTLCMTYMTFEDHVFDALNQLSSSINESAEIFPQHFFKVMEASQLCWTLEDFHKIKQTEQRKLLEYMKVFSSLATHYGSPKIIAVGTTQQIARYVAEQQDNISTIFVPPMSHDEILQIIEIGTKLMNIKITQQMKEEVVEHTNGLVAICHQLLFNICLKAGIFETQPSTREITESEYYAALNTTPRTLI